MQGIIKSVVTERGFGFIKPRGCTSRDDELFYHASALQGGLEFGTHLLRMEVEFDIVPHMDRQRAVNVRPAE